jgi:hypothetical protein
LGSSFLRKRAHKTTLTKKTERSKEKPVYSMPGMFSDLTNTWTPNYDASPFDTGFGFHPYRGPEPTPHKRKQKAIGDRRLRQGIYVLELHGSQDQLAQLVFTGQQWNRFCDALPILRKFLGEPSYNGDHSVVTFFLDMNNSDFPGSNTGALEIVYRAILWSHSDESRDDKRSLVHVETPETQEREPWRAKLSRSTPDEVRNANAKEMAHMEEASAWTDFLSGKPWAAKLLDVVATQEHAFVQYIQEESIRANDGLHLTLYAEIRQELMKQELMDATTPPESFDMFWGSRLVWALLEAGDVMADAFIVSLKAWGGGAGFKASGILSDFYTSKNANIEKMVRVLVAGIEAKYPPSLFNNILLVCITRPLMFHSRDVASRTKKYLGVGLLVPDEYSLGSVRLVFPFAETEEYRILLCGLRAFFSGRLDQLYVLVKDGIQMLQFYTRAAFPMITVPATIPFPVKSVNPSMRSDFGSLVYAMLENVGVPEPTYHLNLEYLHRLRLFMLYAFFLNLHYYGTP